MKNEFPDNFLWGTATAAHQVEGDNIWNDFWDWETKNKDIPNSGKACDHYNLYKKDFKLVKNVLHNNSHRISVEWSRIEPKEGIINKQEIKHYKEVLAELRKNKIKVMLTLHHFTNPLWFTKKGGWEKKENIVYFEKFVKLVVKEFGNYVDYWCVINEPNVYMAMSYLKGFWTPSKQNFLLGLSVYLNMAGAHNKSYKIIHSKIPNAIVGSAINMTYFKGKSFLDRIFSAFINEMVNMSFIYFTRRSHDYIGINSYFFKPISIVEELFKSSAIERKDLLKIIYRKRSDLGWVVYPQGVYHTCKSTWKRFKIPIIITENGVADKTDLVRQKYLTDNLTWIKAAIDEGVDIKGYFHWSLMDNIEWGLGKKARFGLFRTDFNSQKRTPRKSALIFGKISLNNSIQK